MYIIQICDRNRARSSEDPPIIEKGWSEIGRDVNAKSAVTRAKKLKQTYHERIRVILRK